MQSRHYDDNEQYNKLTIYNDKCELCYPTSYIIKMISTAEKLVSQHTKVCAAKEITIHKPNFDVLNLIRGLRMNYYNMQKDTQDGSNNHYFTLVRCILASPNLTKPHKQKKHRQVYIFEHHPIIYMYVHEHMSIWHKVFWLILNIYFMKYTFMLHDCCFYFVIYCCFVWQPAH